MAKDEMIEKLTKENLRIVAENKKLKKFIHHIRILLDLNATSI